MASFIRERAKKEPPTREKKSLVCTPLESTPKQNWNLIWVVLFWGRTTKLPFTTTQRCDVKMMGVLVYISI
eukprot:scaffold1440_cov167-Amphora_coffeaeformis.AAC.3